MSIVCCPLSSSDETSTFSTVTSVRARKPYTCAECHEPIAVGVVHELYKTFFDGAFDSYRTCLSCVEIRNHFACSGWIFGEVWGDLEENFFPDMKAGGVCMEGLSPAAKARLFEKRTAWLFDRGPDDDNDRHSTGATA